MNQISFASACAQAIKKIESGKESPSGIGTLAEGVVHRALKIYFEPDESRHEIEIGGYVADAAGEDGIIEVQTAGFGRMRPKLEAFLSAAPVTLVHPIIAEKTIFHVNPDSGQENINRITSRRKSPKRLNEWSVFRELYPIRDLLPNPSLKICLCLIRIDEHRFGQKRRWQKWKDLNIDPPRKYPTELIREVWLGSPPDYSGLFLNEDIVAGIPPEFTAANFAFQAGISAEGARLALPVLCELGLVRCMGKRGNSYLYSLME